MKKLLVILGVGLMLLGLVACAEAQTYEAYATIDINPSIGFVVNEKNMIKTAYGLNEDGEMLMLQLNLAEKSVETAMGEVIDKAMDLGFIDVEATETVIEVDAIGDTDKITERIRTMVQEKVSDAMSDRALNANVRTRVYGNEIATAAQNKGLTPMQYRLMQSALEIDPELTEEEALEATPEGLVSRIRANNNIVAGVARTLVDEFKVEKDAILAIYQPQIQELREEIATLTEEGEDTAILEAELAALLQTMRTELQAVVQTYIAQSIPLMTAIQTQYQARIQLNAEKVSQYRAGLPNIPNGGKTTTAN